VERYVEDGTLKIEWRDFPYLGEESMNAALAARAAQEQGKFWEYHDLLYENQSSPGAFSDENLVALAREVGLDVEEFEASLSSGEHRQVVTEAFTEGQRSGITGTPTFIINGTTLVGAQPLEAFEEAIEEAAREARDG
jgi:protein-disulfide isomerase